MNKLLTLESLDLKNKKVFLRVDYNVVADGKIIDEFRVKIENIRMVKRRRVLTKVNFMAMDY